MLDKKTTEKELLDFYKQLDYNGHSFGSKKIITWSKKVYEKHKGLRKILGGIGKVIKISEHKPITLYRTGQYRDLISFLKDHNIYSSYLQDYDLDSKVFQQECIPSGAKLSRHLLKYVKTYTHTNEAHIKQLQEYLSALGEAKKRSKVDKNSWYCHFTTSPQAFMLLGHYPTDHGSCFRFGRCAGTDKMRIALMPTSFVLLISKHELSGYGESEKNKIVGRCWGYFNSTFTKCTITNKYTKNNVLTRADMLDLAEKAIRKTIKNPKKNKTIESYRNSHDRGSSGVYTNGDGQTFTYNQTDKTQNPLRVPQLSS